MFNSKENTKNYNKQIFQIINTNNQSKMKKERKDNRLQKTKMGLIKNNPNGKTVY